MFSRQKLISELPRMVGSEAPPLEVVEYGEQDFAPGCSELSIWAFRGSKRQFADALHFWVRTLQALGWEGRETYFMPYAKGGLCEPISEGEFSRLIGEYSGSLRHPVPPFLRELSGFRSGLRMYSDWNHVAAVAEVDESFVAFYWSTSA